MSASVRRSVKSLKTLLTRQRWFYRLLFRLRASFYAACEALSAAASRVCGRSILLGIDVASRPEPAGKFKYELAVCLRFKNEARYLAEWIDFHSSAGVDHFYLYNNNSTDGFRETLTQYVREGLVTLHEWPATPASPAADLHCITHCREEARWLAFIDADEFLFSTGGLGLKDILRKVEAFPALAVNWIYFGCNGHLARPAGGVLENYTRRAESPNRHVKSIVNPRKVIKYGNSHYWLYSGGALPVNTRLQKVYGSFSEPPVDDLLRINHYYSKSREDFMAKAAMKSWVDKEGARFPSRVGEAWERIASDHNDVEDTSACPSLAGVNSDEYATP